MQANAGEPAAPATSGTVTGVQPVLHIGYRGTGGGLFALTAKNLLLTLLTLGIYWPWARTARRKYLWQNIDVGGHRLRYHGTGRELLLGYSKVALAYLVLIVVPMGIGQIDQMAGFVAQGVGVLVLLLLIPAAIYGAARYQLSRTSLRGVRFGLDPGAREFWKKFMGGYALTVLSLGFYFPIWQNRLRAFMLKRMRYGSEPFDYDGADKQAFKIVMKGLLLSVLTLGMYFPWYTASVARFRTDHTQFQGVYFRLDLTGLDVLKIFLLSMFGTMLTLGIAFPWVFTWVMRTISSKIVLAGSVDFARVAQHATGGSAAADGLADALDVGLGL